MIKDSTDRLYFSCDSTQSLGFLSERDDLLFLIRIPK